MCEDREVRGDADLADLAQGVQLQRVRGTVNKLQHQNTLRESTPNTTSHSRRRRRQTCHYQEIPQPEPPQSS